MNTVLTYAIQFFIGGGIIVGMSFLAKNVEPKYAAILYALPIQFTIAIIIIYLQTNEGVVQELAKNSLIYIIGFVGFIVAFYFLIKHFSFWLSLGISYMLLIIVTALILNIQKI